MHRFLNIMIFIFIVGTTYCFANDVYQPKLITEVSVNIAEPQIGQKPATDAKSINEGYIVTGVHWNPEDTVFKADTDYTVSLDIKLIDGYLLRSDYVRYCKWK